MQDYSGKMNPTDIDFVDRYVSDDCIKDRQSERDFIADMKRRDMPNHNRRGDKMLTWLIHSKVDGRALYLRLPTATACTLEAWDWKVRLAPVRSQILDYLRWARAGIGVN